MQPLPLKTERVLQAAGFLSAHMIWQGVPEAHLRALLAQHGTLYQYEKGEHVWGEDTGYRQALGLVLQGAVQVKKERVLLSVHREGDYFGLVTLYYPSGYYAAEIEALRPSSVLFLAKEAMDSLLDADPALAKRYIAYLSQRVYYLNSRLDAVTAGSAPRRLEYYLRTAAEADEQGRLVCSIASQTALAKSLNMGRATLYRAMEELQRLGVVESSSAREVVLAGSGEASCGCGSFAGRDA